MRRPQWQQCCCKRKQRPKKKVSESISNEVGGQQGSHINGGIAVATDSLVKAEVGGLVADVNLGQAGLELGCDVGTVGGLGQGGKGHAGGDEEVL